MHRRFITMILAASIAITGFTAAPARAGDKDLARILAAIAGIAVIGAIVKERKDDKVARQQYNPVHRQTYDPYRAQRRHDVKPLPRRVARKLLPGQCLRSHATNRGNVRFFGNRCLQNNYKYVNQLPAHCFQRVRTDRGPRQGYGVRCLRDQGFQIARN